MTVLVDSEIERLALTENLIVEFDKDSVQGASYDLRLGAQLIRSGKVESLSDGSPTLALGPGEFAVLRSLEVINMPKNLVGHNGIMSPWAKRGLISLFSPQIDPGFRGFLIVPVVNGGDSPISMNFKQRIFTVEFMRTRKSASYGWSDRNGIQDRLDVPPSPHRLQPEFSTGAQLNGDVAKLKSEVAVLTSKLDQLSDSRRLRLVRIGIAIGLVSAGIAFGNSGLFRDKILPFILSKIS